MGRAPSIDLPNLQLSRLSFLPLCKKTPRLLNSTRASRYAFSPYSPLWFPPVTTTVVLNSTLAFAKAPGLYYHPISAYLVLNLRSS